MIPSVLSNCTRNAAFEAVSALEQNCSTPLLKLECSVWDRIFKRSKSSLNTSTGAKHAMEPRIGKWSFQIQREFCKLYTDRAFVHTGNTTEQFLHCNRTLILVYIVMEQFSKSNGAEQNPIWYSVNMALEVSQSNISFNYENT